MFHGQEDHGFLLGEEKEERKERIWWKDPREVRGLQEGACRDLRRMNAES